MADKKNAPIKRENKGMVTEGLDKDTLSEEGFPAVLSDCFARYAKMVLTDRAIPDVRDGLKPVQRRIIFDMWKNGITPDKKTVKCAKTVGDVLGNFHPHGDSSVYDAMVRLSQDWKMEVPLLKFQGNNGSMDNDPAAAYRYTECKLSEASMFLCKDLDEQTVDMTLTFDDMNVEPVVLPAGFPNLLINGSSGIAVGNATNIPTHNPTEVINAVIHRIEHPSCPLDALTNIVKGPDFPTGGIIDDQEAIQKLYRTGQASFYIHSKTEIDEKKNAIIITEIPYGVVKSQMVADLDNRRINDHLDNVSEILDESSTDVRIAIYVKKGTSPLPVLNYLQNKGALRTTFSANMLALDKGHPRTLSLLAIIDSYIAHRQDVVTKRSSFELNKAKARLEIVEGLLKAKSIIDEVIKVIRNSESRVEAKKNMMEKFGFTANQADAIGNMRLYSLTRIDIIALQEEKKQLIERIAELNNILSDRSKLNRVIARELKDVLKVLGKDRKTVISETHVVTSTSVDPKSLIAKEECMVVLTRDGYIKRTNMRSYQSTVTGNAVSDLPTIKVGDEILLSRQGTTHDDVLAFTTRGNYIIVPVWQIGEGKWHEEGKHLNNIISMDSNEKIISAYLVDKYKEGLVITCLSKLSKIKRVKLNDLSVGKLTSRPNRVMGLTKDDSMVGALITSGDSDLIVIAQDGNANRFNENEVPVVSLQASGVKAMNQPSKPVDMATFLSLDAGEDGKALFVFEARKTTAISTLDIHTTPRLGAKTQAVRIPKSSYTKIVAVKMLTKTGNKYDSVLLSVSDGTFNLDVSGLATSEIGVLIRTENIPLKNKSAKIIGIHSFGELINKDSLVEKPKKVYTSPIKAKDDGSTKQPTFFDILSNDLGAKKKK